MALQLAAMVAGPLIGSILGSSAQKKMANRATAAQQEGFRRAEGAYTTARAENRALLNPYVQQGARAQNEYMRALMGAGGVGLTQNGAIASGAAAGPNWGSYLANNPDVAESAQREVAAGTFGSLEEAAAAHYQQHGEREGRGLEGAGGGGTATAPAFYGPDNPERQVMVRPDVGTRPDLARPDIGARPDTPMPGFEEFSYGADDYRESPAFQHQMSRGLEAVAQSKALGGARQSGAATNAALEFATQLAYDDFAAERSFAQGVHRDSRDTRRSWADADANRSDRRYEWGAGRSDANHQFDVGRLDRNFEWGAGRSDNNFVNDRNFGADIHNIDRTYNTSRFDARQSGLAGIANQGYGATTAIANGNNAYAGQLAAGAMGSATAQGNNFLYQGQQTAGMWNNLGQAAGFVAGGGSAGPWGQATGHIAPTNGAAAYPETQRFLSNPFLTQLSR